jgi:MFS family permease
VTQDNPDPPGDGIAARLGRLPILRNPAFRLADYRRFWVGAGLNQLGTSGEQVVLGLLVFQITESSAWVGALMAVYFLPMFVFGLLSGAISDWMDRRQLLRRVELCIVANSCALAAMIAAGFVELWLILSFALLAGCFRALHHPTRFSYAYDIVGGNQVVAGLGLLNLGSRTGQLIGALVSGFVMERFGAPAAILTLALCHGGAFLLFCQLETAGEAAEKVRAPIVQNVREYVGELKTNRVLLMLVLVTASVEVFGFSFATALPELATVRFSLGAEGLGMMHAARSIGGIIAGLTLAGMGSMTRRGVAYIVVIFAFGSGLILLSVADHLMLAVAALCIVAALATASDVLTQSMVQLSVPNALRGRAMGAWTLAIGSAPLGHLEMGALAVAIGIGNALFVNGTMLILVGIVVFFAAPRLRSL